MRRILSVLICIFILLSTVSCTTPHVGSPITNTDDTQKDQSPESYEKQKRLYDNIIVQYTSLLKAKQSGEDIPIPNNYHFNQKVASFITVCQSEKILIF